MQAEAGWHGGMRRRMSRREALRIGALGGVGLALPELLAGRALGSPRSGGPGGKAKGCILLYMYGGPAHQDIWDLKPDAPAEVRGEFQPIATSVPGIRIGEHLPHLARQAQRYAIVRSLTHSDSTHETAFYAMLTGRMRPAPFGLAPLPTDHPHLGSVVARLRSQSGAIPSFVATRETIENGGGEQQYPGLGPGFLGSAYGPLVIRSQTQQSPAEFLAASRTTGFPPGAEGPQWPGFGFSGLDLSAGMSLERLDQRRRILDDDINRQRDFLGQAASARAYDIYSERAFSLLTSPAVRRAIDISAEPPQVRERYGPTVYGQHLLLARRLVEAGVSLVTVYWNLMISRGDVSPGQPWWDTHKNNFVKLKDYLLPSVDRPISVLLDDLAERGLLDQTLVVWLSEFGRTPGINKDGGREHWPHANSVVLAGGGIQGGQVYGATDKHAAHPAGDPVTPGDLAATIFDALGIDPASEIPDQLQRPHRIAEGTPIARLFRPS